MRLRASLAERTGGSAEARSGLFVGLFVDLFVRALCRERSGGATTTTSTVGTLSITVRCIAPSQSRILRFRIRVIEFIVQFDNELSYDRNSYADDHGLGMKGTTT